MRWKTISLDGKVTDKTGACRLSLHNKNKTKLKEIKAKATSTLALVIAGEYSDCCVSSVSPRTRQKSDKSKMFFRGGGVLLSVLNWTGCCLFVFGSCVCVFKVKTCRWMGGDFWHLHRSIYKHTHNYKWCFIHSHAVTGIPTFLSVWHPTQRSATGRHTHTGIKTNQTNKM